VKTSPQIEGINPRIARLTDLMHGAGSTRIAVLASLVMAMCITHQVSTFSFGPMDILRFVLMIIVWDLLTTLHWKGFSHLTILTRKMVEGALADALNQERKKSGQPISIHLSDGKN
jgi:hypothetical protein